MKSLFILLVASCLMGLSSCKSMTQLTPLSLLKVHHWTLSSLSGENLGEFSDQLPSLDFMDGGKLSGFTGCNSFTGNFTLQEDTISLDFIAMTRRACLGNGETHFINALEKVSHFTVGEDKLTLFENGTELMTFVPQPKP